MSSNFSGWLRGKSTSSFNSYIYSDNPPISSKLSTGFVSTLIPSTLGSTSSVYIPDIILQWSSTFKYTVHPGSNKSLFTNEKHLV